MCNEYIKSVVCGAFVLLCFVWMAQAQTDQCRGRASIILAVPGGVGQASKVLEENLIDLMYHFTIDELNINIGLLLYGEQSHVVLAPGDFRTRTQVNTQISLMSQRQLYYSGILGQGQDLVKGLVAMETMFRDVPPGVRKIGVVFSEGLINSTVEEGSAILDAAARLKRSGVVMYNLGSNVSSEVGGVFELTGSDRCRLFSMGNFTDSLSSAVPYLASGICSEIDPTQVVTQGNCYPKTYAREQPLTLTCPRLINYVLLPDPNNCVYYYQCVPRVDRVPRQAAGNNRAVPENNRFVPEAEITYPPFYIRNDPVRRQCSDGTLFENGVCNHASLVNC